MGNAKLLSPAKVGASAQLLALREELSLGKMPVLQSLVIAGREGDTCQGRDAFWAMVRRPRKGGLAVRAAHRPGGATSIKHRRNATEVIPYLEIESAMDTQTVTIARSTAYLAILRITDSVRRHTPLLVPFFPRDLYRLDHNDDPLSAEGRVEAAQRGLIRGTVFFHLDRPAFGSVLYFQNFTALSDYLLATKTTPDGSVGGEWPELGYLAPTAQSRTPPTDPLPAREDTIISDALIVFHNDAIADEQKDKQ